MSSIMSFEWNVDLHGKPFKGSYNTTAGSLRYDQWSRTRISNPACQIVLESFAETLGQKQAHARRYAHNLRANVGQSIRTSCTSETSGWRLWTVAKTMDMEQIRHCEI
eukprot:4289876-Amphidinium_carterae.1